MMRAYCHFLLVNLYAEPYTHCTPATTRGVPMMLEADVNAIPLSSSVETVYQQVLSDIVEAEKHLNVDKWAVSAPCLLRLFMRVPYYIWGAGRRR